MNYLKFKKWYELALEILVPISFFAIAASEGNQYWIAGVMTILVLYGYGLKYFAK